MPRKRPTSPVGLYDPSFEHDSCGVAIVARLSGEKTHETEAGEFWSEMVRDPKMPFAVMKKPEYIDPAPLLK